MGVSVCKIRTGCGEADYERMIGDGKFDDLYRITPAFIDDSYKCLLKSTGDDAGNGALDVGVVGCKLANVAARYVYSCFGQGK